MTERFNPRALDTIAYQHHIRSDTKLAAHLGVSRSTLIRWRNGSTQPTFAAIARMTLDEGLPIDELLIDDDTESTIARAA